MSSPQEVLLVSNSDTKFYLPREATYYSKVLYTLFNNKKWSEARSNSIKFENIDTETLRIIVDYCNYRYNSTSINNYTTIIPSNCSCDLAIKLLLAAEFLQI